MEIKFKMPCVKSPIAPCDPHAYPPLCVDGDVLQVTEKQKYL